MLIQESEWEKSEKKSLESIQKFWVNKNMFLDTYCISSYENT